MGCEWGISVLTLVSLLSLTVASLNNADYFTTTSKPLQCHEIKTFYFRSPVECALYCTTAPYSCAGYVHSKNESSRFHCEVCFIYDVVANLTTADASDDTIVTMPDIDITTGEYDN